MIKTKTYCNHCGKEVDGMIDYVNMDVKVNHKWFELDLCVDCFEKLCNLISEYSHNAD